MVEARTRLGFLSRTTCGFETAPFALWQRAFPTMPGARGHAKCCLVREEFSRFCLREVLPLGPLSWALLTQASRSSAEHGASTRTHPHLLNIRLSACSGDLS